MTSPNEEAVKADLNARLWPHIVRNPETGCHEWTGYKTRGYGRISTRRLAGWPRASLVHRVVYVLAKGEIPTGLQLDHLCRNKVCCNPDHLEATDSRTNTLRGVGPTAARAAATHCPKGHPYWGENLYPIPSGGRGCRACRREADRLRGLARRRGKKI